MAQLVERFLDDLPYALACQALFHADLCHRHGRLTIANAKICGDDVFLALCECVERVGDMPFEVPFDQMA